MKKNLMYGTATALLIVMASLSVGAEEAFAAKGAWVDPSTLIAREYEPPDEVVQTLNEVEEESSAMSSLVLDIAMGVALTAAGVEIVRQMPKSGSEPGQMPDETQDDPTASSVDSGNMANE